MSPHGDAPLSRDEDLDYSHVASQETNYHPCQTFPGGSGSHTESTKAELGKSYV